MRTKEEILIDNLMSVNDSINAITELGIVDNIKSAMEEYAQQVKSVDLADVGGSLPTQDEIKEEAEKLYKSMMNGTFEDIRQAKTSQLMFLSGAWFARGFKKQ